MADVFGSRLRLRWSVRFAAWFIEEQVGRAALLPIRVEEWDDGLICARDGYRPVMMIQPGTKMACRSCHLPIPVPVMETAEARCDACLRRNIDARFMTSYYPLGEVLIDHLRRIDPEAQAGLKDRILSEEAREERLRRHSAEAQDREGAAQFKDALLDQIPTAGFPSLTLDAWRH